MSPRRGLIAFDVSAIPSNATVTVVSLKLRIGQLAGSGGGSEGGGFQNPEIGLHKMLVDWGEARTGESESQDLNGIGQGGPALAGDATWRRALFWRYQPGKPPAGSRVSNLQPPPARP